MAVEALVNRIIPFSSVDGPGNRTAIFLQGCNFDCVYCHNPETIRVCAGCGTCVDHCPAGALRLSENGTGVIFEQERCQQCDTCIRVCPHNSSPRVCRMTAQQVLEVARGQMPYIRGITVSGGECTRQRDFLVELFELAHREGLHCLLDSNGSLDFSEDPCLMALTDGVMLDIKALDPADHLRITGQNNEIVLKNAVYLAAAGKLTELRTVVVPGLFDPEKAVTGVLRLLQPYLDGQVTRYKLIRYRPMGVRPQYSGYPVPDMEQMESLKKLVETFGIPAVIA